ncbi:metal ABC transporter solute-binding protein, Zn/Mn family [Thalassococcus lentus]|uniref:Zinc ABC transporter substrate-binding protein n=1 Tax=Thalassococcus lentus TaxID=1210524 RepID=A0ABT4XSV7_9RHOB|nr:zinc ABC transporter substrate-binding protein [Thalassococcus lentus]MDA7425044.1 zinc ABC transporter substrate-binding protein [Thalassococcus lentus]
MNLTRRALISSMAAAPLLGSAAWADTPLRVVATTGMVADAARAIGGGDAVVTALMGAGVDPHAYRQTRSDIVAMTRADLVLSNGLYLEAQLESFLETLARRTTVVAVAEGTPKSELIRHADYAGKADPHIWMVPGLWQHAVRETLVAMQQAAPEKADRFAVNAQAYLSEIETVGNYARDTLAMIPEQARVLVTAHDAFAYFGQAYGFEVEGIQGISTESEAGLQRIGTLVDMLVTRKISAVFVESSVSDRNIRALIEGAAARGHTVSIGGELFSDAMGMPGTYEGTYVGMIDHNSTVIARALGADVPPQGMNGKLAAGL